MEGILPPAIQWRTHKSNLGVNLRTVRAHEPERLRQVVALARAHLGERLDLARLEAAVEGYLARPTEAESALLHGAGALALWAAARASESPSPATGAAPGAAPRAPEKAESRPGGSGQPSRPS
jgi:hypothetical protein